MKSDFTQQNINAQTSLETPEDFTDLVVATRDNTVIRLGQIATVDLGPENFDSKSAFDGLKAVFMGIQTTPDANPLTVISAVRDAMPEIQRACHQASKRTLLMMPLSSSTPRSGRSARPCSRRD